MYVYSLTSLTTFFLKRSSNGFLTDNQTTDAEELKTFVHSPELIASQFSTQPMNMLTLIHTNYLCHFHDIEDIVRASDSLSLSDDVLNEWRVGRDETFLYYSSDLWWKFIQLQEDLSSEIGINLAVRGIMVWNQKPVTGRWMPIRSAKVQKNR